MDSVAGCAIPHPAVLRTAPKRLVTSLSDRSNLTNLPKCFVGHFALGFAAKRVTPRVSLAVLFLAAQLADVLWPELVAAGVERVRIDPGNTAFTPLNFISYPYSHSLLLLAVWGMALGLAFRSVAHKNAGRCSY